MCLLHNDWRAERTTKLQRRPALRQLRAGMSFLAKGMNVSCANIAGHSYILKEDTKELLALNCTGTYIWNLIDGKVTDEDILGAVLLRYNCDEVRVREGVRSFLRLLIEREVAQRSKRPFEGVMANDP